MDCTPSSDLTVKLLTRSVTSSTGPLGRPRHRGHSTPPATRSSTRTQAVSRSPNGRSSGMSPAHTSSANAHRGRNAQPDGGRSMFGGDPAIGVSRSRPESGQRARADPGCRGGRSGRTARRTVPRSTTRPAYITCTRSATRAMTPRSWVMKHDRRAQLVLDPLDHLEDLRLHRDVERRGRLVGDEHLGVVGDRPWRSSPAGACRRRTRGGTGWPVSSAAGSRPGRAARPPACRPACRSTSWWAWIISAIWSPTLWTGFSAESGSWKMMARSLASHGRAAPSCRRRSAPGRAPWPSR